VDAGRIEAHERGRAARRPEGELILTRIDHLMVCVPDLARGAEAYARLGFSVHPGGVHTGLGTHNAIAFLEQDYLELIAIRDRDEYLRASPYAGLVKFLEAGGGLRYIIVQSNDLEADIAAMRSRGVDVGDAKAGSRRTPSGGELRWKSAMLGPRNPLPLFFIQHLTPIKERRRLTPGAGKHPNGVQRADRTYIAVQDLQKEAEIYSRVLGVTPTMERGKVIMADMAIFALGDTAVVLAHPYAPGPAADALARRGPGPFQILYRTSSMDAAAKWMAEHGVPPPARGVRNTGEQAMLVPPEHACGAYIGFVGPA
jgi:catechol 2,3-dioxygenase-like lactoylglutathione lyase family enzyme